MFEMPMRGINLNRDINASPLSQNSYTSKIPRFKGLNKPQSIINLESKRSVEEKQEDLMALHQQNIKLRDMVLIVVNKLENFIDRTIEVKERKKLINQGGKPPENEIAVQKQSELDSYLTQIRDSKRQIKKMRAELDKDTNFKRMIESENIAKE